MDSESQGLTFYIYFYKGTILCLFISITQFSWCTSLTLCPSRIMTIILPRNSWVWSVVHVRCPPYLRLQVNFGLGLYSLWNKLFHWRYSPHSDDVIPLETSTLHVHRVANPSFLKRKYPSPFVPIFLVDPRDWSLSKRTSSRPRVLPISSSPTRRRVTTSVPVSSSRIPRSVWTDFKPTNKPVTHICLVDW